MKELQTEDDFSSIEPEGREIKVEYGYALMGQKKIPILHSEYSSKYCPQYTQLLYVIVFSPHKREMPSILYVQPQPGEDETKPVP